MPDSGNSKGAEDGGQGAATVSLRRDLAQAASRPEADTLLAATVAHAGGRNHLGVDDQLALIHANIRWAPEGKQFCLDALQQAKLDEWLLPHLGAGGHDPLLVAQVLTQQDNKVRNPVGVLIKRLDVLGLLAPGQHETASPDVVWVEHQPEPLTGRAVDRVYTAADYAKPL